MPLSEFPLRASVAVSDIGRAVAFYEGKLGLEPFRHLLNDPRFALNVYQSLTAGTTSATLATWYVDDLDDVVDELAAAGVELVHYDGFGQDVRGIAPRAGGGRIAWIQDPDGNTFALESDT